MRMPVQDEQKPLSQSLAELKSLFYGEEIPAEVHMGARHVRTEHAKQKPKSTKPRKGKKDKKKRAQLECSCDEDK
jgi:hypothetical protein